MRKHIINCTLTSILSLIAATAVQAQSGAYFTAVTNLNPLIYLPLTEAAQPPATTYATNDGTLGIVDSGVYSQGAYPGAPGAIVGDSDTACYLSADDNYMSAPYDTAYTGVTNFTLEFWFNSANQDPGEDCIIDCVDPDSPRHGWLIYTDGNEVGSFNFRSYHGVDTSTAINYNIPVPGGHILANTWYYVVVTFSETASDTATNTTAQGYINGTAVSGNGTASTGPTYPAYVPSQAAPLFIGARSDLGFPFYPGAMDELAFYSNVLSASVISNHYAAGIGGVAGAYYTAVTSAQPLLYYRLDEPLPLATNYGTVGALAKGFYQSGTTPGVPGPDLAGLGGADSLAVQFPSGPATYNGATVMVPGASLLPIGRTANSPVTVSAWVNVPYVPTDFSTVLGKGDSSYRFDVGIASDGGAGNPHWNAGAFGDITASAAYPSGLADGNWHFWAGTWDGSNAMSFYIDGALVAQSFGNTANTFNTNVLDIGAAPDYVGRNFDDGSLCQVAIFTNALSQNQVTSLYFASGVTGVPPIITTQPQDTVANLGSNVTLTVSALGFQPLTYQWYSNSVPVGANSSSFTINDVTASADGQYYVTVTDGEATPEQTISATASLIVVTPLPGTYFSAVAALGPIGYWPLNETTQPSTDTSTPETNEPVATNYGVLGAADNGYYLPGTSPGSVPGPSVAGFPGTGPNNVAVAFNSADFVSGSINTNSTEGIGGFVDVPVDANNSLNDTNEITLAAWIQATPNDGRFETVLGRGDDSYRFDVDGTSSDLAHFADVGGDLDGVAPAGQLNDGKWHFVVGTYNGAQEVLYIDGVENTSQAESGSATGTSLLDFTIGEAPDYGGSRAFDGNIAQVAIFDYALSPVQVQSLFYAAGIATYIETEPPATLIVPVGTTTNISVVANGTPTLTYMWSTNNGGSLLAGTNFSGTTSSTLTIATPALTDSGTYVVVISNAFGSVTSTPTVFTVSSKPVLTALPATNYVLIGTTLTLSIGETGIMPITNVWYANGAILSDGALPSGAIISGSQTSTLTISNAQAADAGDYVFYATNLYGTSSTAGVVVVDLEPEVRDPGIYSVNLASTPFGLSSFTPVVSNGVLQLTSATAPNSGIEANSYWFNQKYYVGAFKVHFVFTDVNDNVGGVCFVLQNSTQGLKACGDCGSCLGVAAWQPYTFIAITNSFEFEIDNAADAIAIDTNGAASPEWGVNGPTDYTNASPEYVPGDYYGHPGGSFDFWLTYITNTISVVYSNETTGITDSSFVTNVGPDFVESAVGNSNTAYMGFTAGTQIGYIDRTANEGYLYGSDSFYISKFTYTPIIPMSITKTNGGDVVLNWPAGVGGYSLQETSNLSSTNWTTVPVPYATNSSGMYQYTVAPATGTEFYRLVLSPASP